MSFTTPVMLAINNHHLCGSTCEGCNKRISVRNYARIPLAIGSAAITGSVAIIYIANPARFTLTEKIAENMLFGGIVVSAVGAVGGLISLLRKPFAIMRTPEGHAFIAGSRTLPALCGSCYNSVGTGNEIAEATLRQVMVDGNAKCPTVQRCREEVERQFEEREKAVARRVSLSVSAEPAPSCELRSLHSDDSHRCGINCEHCHEAPYKIEGIAEFTMVTGTICTLLAVEEPFRASLASSLFGAGITLSMVGSIGVLASIYLRYHARMYTATGESFMAGSATIPALCWKCFDKVGEGTSPVEVAARQSMIDANVTCHMVQTFRSNIAETRAVMRRSLWVDKFLLIVSQNFFQASTLAFMHQSSCCFVTVSVFTWLRSPVLEHDWNKGQIRSVGCPGAPPRTAQLNA